MDEEDILLSKQVSPRADEEVATQLYRPWDYLKRALGLQPNAQEARSHQRGPYNLSKENPGDRVPASKYDRLVTSPHKTRSVDGVVLPALRRPPSVKVGSIGQSKKRSSSLATVRTTGSSTTYSPAEPRNAKHAPYESLNPIRYRLFLDQLSSQKRSIRSPDPSLLASPSETSLLSTDKQKAAARPWIGFRYNLKRTDPVVFSPVLVVNSDLLESDDASSLAESHRYRIFTQSGNKSMFSSAPVLQNSPLNCSNVLSKADESLLCGYNTMHACKRMLEQSFSKRSSSTTTHRSMSNGSGPADAEHAAGATSSIYDSVLLEFADDVVPFAKTSNPTPHQRALIKAQDQRIQRLVETQPNAVTDPEPPSFASYYVRSRRGSTGASSEITQTN